MKFGTVTTMVRSKSPKPAPVQSTRITDRRAMRLQELVVVATRLFNRNGVLATRMEELAQAADMTPGNLYRYVKSKEELAYLCYLRSCNIRRSQLLAAENQALDGLGQLEFFFKQLLTEDQHRTAILGEIGALKPEWADEIQRLQRDNTAVMQRLIAAGVADNSLRECNPYLTGIGLLGIVEWISFWFTTRLPYTRDEITEIMWDIVSFGVTADRPYDVSAVPTIEQPSSPPRLADPFDKEAMSQMKLQSFLRAAMHSFNRNGVKATSIEKLASQLNVTKGAFYHYFGSKEELLFHCYERAIEFNRNVVPIKPRDGNEHEVLIRRAVFERHVSELGPFPVYSNVRALEGAHQQKILKQLDDVVSGDARRIEQAIAVGDFRQTDYFIAEKVRAGLINWFPIWYSPGRISPTEVADNHSDIFLNGIANT